MTKRILVRVPLTSIECEEPKNNLSFIEQDFSSQDFLLASEVYDSSNLSLTVSIPFKKTQTKKETITDVWLREESIKAATSLNTKRLQLLVDAASIDVDCGTLEFDYEPEQSVMAYEDYTLLTEPEKVERVALQSPRKHYGTILEEGIVKAGPIGIPYPSTITFTERKTLTHAEARQERKEYFTTLLAQHGITLTDENNPESVKLLDNYFTTYVDLINAYDSLSEAIYLSTSNYNIISSQRDSIIEKLVKEAFYFFSKSSESKLEPKGNTLLQDINDYQGKDAFFKKDIDTILKDQEATEEYSALVKEIIQDKVTLDSYVLSGTYPDGEVEYVTTTTNAELAEAWARGSIDAITLASLREVDRKKFASAYLIDPANPINRRSLLKSPSYDAKKVTLLSKNLTTFNVSRKPSMAALNANHLYKYLTLDYDQLATLRYGLNLIGASIVQTRIEYSRNKNTPLSICTSKIHSYLTMRFAEILSLLENDHSGKTEYEDLIANIYDLDFSVNFYLVPRKIILKDIPLSELYNLQSYRLMNSLDLDRGFTYIPGISFNQKITQSSDSFNIYRSWKLNPMCCDLVERIGEICFQ
jgi:hypothetical protein